MASKLIISVVLAVVMVSLISCIESHPGAHLKAEAEELDGEPKCKECCCGWCVSCRAGLNASVEVLPNPAFPSSLQTSAAVALVPESTLNGKAGCACCCGWCISC